MKIEQLPHRDDHPYILEVDNTELETFSHMPRCYFWEHVMGLVPAAGRLDDMVETAKQSAALVWGSAVHRFLEFYYGGLTPLIAMERTLAEYGDRFEALEISGDYRTAGRLQLVMEQYLDDPDIITRDKYYTVLATEQYVMRPIDGDVGHGGKIDDVMFDERDNSVVIWDHKTSKKKVKSDYFMDWFNLSYQITGYYWHGEHITNLLKEDGTIPGDSVFRGVMINAMQTTKTIEYEHASALFSRTDTQIADFVRSAWILSHEILERKQKTIKLLEAGDPPENAWPYWPNYGENFCKWKDLNTVTPEIRDQVLDVCIFDPWWERRRTK